MRILKQYRPRTGHHKPDNRNPEREIVFFDELNCGWVMDKQMMMKTNSVRSFENTIQAMMLFNNIINNNKEKT